MNLSNLASKVIVFDALTEHFNEYATMVGKTEMMGVSDNAFLIHSLDMPYRNAKIAFDNLKHYVAFRTNDRSRHRMVSVQEFVQGTALRPSRRHVYVFNYKYDEENDSIFIYDRETGKLELTSADDAYNVLSAMFLK